MADQLETALLQALNERGTVADSGDLAKELGVDHMQLVGTIRSLQASEMIVAEVRTAKGNSSCGAASQGAPPAQHRLV
jgi:phenylalanyl-tRNA synthetase alpha chain